MQWTAPDVILSVLLLFGVSPLMARNQAMAQNTTLSAEESPASLPWMQASQARLQAELVSRYGEGQRGRIERGLRQAGQFWRSEDGDGAEFESFARENFAGDQATLDQVFARFQRLLEQLDGHMHEINREFRAQADLDLGPMLPLDGVFAGYDPSAHVTEDFFKNKLAFVVLLNFPLTTLQERLTQGGNWSRRQWAETRLAERFSKRIPAPVNLAIAQAAAQADTYISQYHIWMYHVLEPGEAARPRSSTDSDDARLFPPGMRLLSHWNLRDEIKAEYADYERGGADAEKALAKQLAIQQVMLQIVTQQIPLAVIDNPQLDWNPFTGQIAPAAAQDSDFQKLRQLPTPLATREPDTRYAMLLGTYQAARLADPYSPTAPSLIERRFNEDRQIPEARFKAMLEQVLTSPLVPRVARLIEQRLGRPLEPFDVWYAGFRPRSRYTEAQLDEIVRRRYPTAEAYRADIPNLLVKLGFSPDRARYVAANIIVDPARGSGHAMGAAMRSEKAHLRTRVEKTGMNYKGFNIAVHEMGHNVEQTFSLNDVDYYFLNGVPNTAFTEAMAFIFQARDLELLDLAPEDPKNAALRALNDFWGTYEIAGVAMVDMAVWHWMYAHPQATPAQLREATLQISRDTWNRYYAPVFRTRDVPLLAIYSHMIDSFMYLPDYPLGHLIAAQIEEHFKKSGNLGAEFERMTRFGNIAPDLWMKNATGAPVSADALLSSADAALAELAGK